MDRQKLTEAYEKLEALRAASADQPARTTSAAKEYFPEGLRGTSLENAPPVAEPFAKAAQPSAEQSTGSEQVRNTGSDLQNRPPPDMARDADRAKHTTGMQSDDAAARRAEYAAMMEKIQEREQGADKAQERGLDHGMG